MCLDLLCFADRLSGKEIALIEQDQKAVVLTKEDFMVKLFVILKFYELYAISKHDA